MPCVVPDEPCANNCGRPRRKWSKRCDECRAAHKVAYRKEKYHKEREANIARSTAYRLARKSPEIAQRITAVRAKIRYLAASKERAKHRIARVDIELANQFAFLDELIGVRKAWRRNRDI